MVIIKRNLKGVLAEEVEREFNEYVRQNSRCPKGTVEPDSFKCPDNDKEESVNTKSPKVSTESTPDKLKNALDNINLLKRDLFTNPLKYGEIKPVGMLESERSKIFNKLSSNTRASTGSDTGKRFASIVKSIKSPEDFEDGLKKLSNLVQDVSLDESKNKVKPGSTKDLIKYIAAQKYRFEKTKTKSNESGNSEEVKQNLRCPKDSYEQGTFKCDPSMSKAVKNEEAKQTAKQGLDKDKDLTLREKTLKQATGLMGELTGKYKALEKELRDKKKGMSNPDSPRNKKQLREIEKKMKAVGDNMDRIQKAMDKNSRGFNAEKKKPGDKAMKKIAEKEKGLDAYANKTKKDTKEKTFEKASERYPDKKASTTVVASGNSFKVKGTGYNGETDDNLVEGLTSRKEAENVAEMIVENTSPGVMAADLNKPIFSVTKEGKTEDDEPVVNVKFWRQDGLHSNFNLTQRNGEWDFPVKDKVFGVDVEKNIDMIKSAIDKTEDGKESPMWVGKRLPESRFKK